MTTVGRIRNDGELFLASELDERTPLIKNGLIAHYPFDGTLNGIRTVKSAKVAGYVVNTSHAWYDWFSTNAGSFTQITDWTNFTVTNAQQYDLIVYDAYVWGVSSADITKLKSFVDAGVSCVATGNDTRTNVFVSSYNATSTNATHNINLEDDLPFYYSSTMSVSGGSSDVISGITGLQAGALPFYRRADTGDITGYYYESTSGAVFVFDQEGIGVQNYHIAAFEYALGKTTILITNTNNTLDLDGISVDQATTNLWSGNFSIYNNNSVPATLTKLTETYKGQPIYRLKMTPNTSTQVSSMQNNLSNQGVYGSYRLYSASTKYAISVYWRTQKSDVSVGLTASNIGGWTEVTDSVQSDGWTRSVAKRDGTVATDKSDNIFFSFKSPSIQLNETIYIDFSCPQIEQGVDYATSYTPSSRSAGKLQLPTTFVNISTGAFKFNFYYEGTKFSNSSNNWMMFTHAHLNSGYENGKINTVIQNNKIYTRFANDTGSTWNSTGFALSSLQKGWNSYAISWNSSTMAIQEALNGTSLATQTSTYMPATAPDIFCIGTWDASGLYANSKISDFSIYNQALVASDLAKLTNPTFLIDQNGVMKTSKLQEKPNGVPADTFYFPLGNDTMDIGNYTVAADTPTIYRDGCAWVSSSYTNLFSPVTSGNFPIKSGKALEILSTNNDSFVYRNKFTGETWNYNGRDIAVSASTTYYVGLEMFVSTDYNGNYSNMASIEQTGATTFSYDMTKKGTWQTFRYNFTVGASAGNSRMLLYPAPNNATATQGYVLYKNPYFIQSNFDRPFVASSANATSLEYNLNRDLSIDWSKDWSIVYWMNPYSTSDGTLTNYCISSLGSNSNSVGGGYIWWGKSSGSNSIANATPSAITPSTYFTNWRMISLTKTGTTITTTEWSYNDGSKATRTDTTTNSVANYYVNQYGYDLKLGGWDNNTGVSAYFRDLIVAKRSLTNTELQTLYSTPMRSYANKLQILGNLQEVSSKLS